MGRVLLTRFSIVSFLLGLARTLLSVRTNISQGRVARYNSSGTVGDLQVGYSCHVQKAGQREGRGQGGFRDNVALVFANLGHGKGGEDGGRTGRKMTGPGRLCFNKGGGARIKTRFSNMPALGQGI